MNRIVNALFLILFITLAALPQAQVSTGDVKGRVTDPSGAVVPGASITVTNVETGVSRTTTTLAIGEYRILVLLPGMYSIKIEAPGFAPQTRPSVQITVGRTVVIDAQLTPASVQAEVIVQTEAPLLEVEKTQQSSTIMVEQIINLPLNKRDFLDLTMLTPGVTDAAGLIAFTLPMLQTSGLSFMGQGARYNSVNVDGVDNNDNAVGAVRSTLSQEAAQEFQVNLANFSAQFGRSSGGLVNIVSRSGTNKLHGDLFAFLRNQALDARNPFAFGAGGTDIDPPFRRWQAGFTLGGPVKKDRTFFFLAYEGLRRRESRFVSFLENTRLFQPTNEQTALISAMASSPLLSTLAGLLRENLTTSSTTFPETVNLLQSNSGVFPFRNNDNKASLRLDHHLKNSNQMFGRLTFADLDTIGETQGGLTAPSRSTTLQIQDYAAVFGGTNFFGSKRVNEFRFQFAYRNFNALPSDRFGPEININGVAFLGRSLYLPSLRTEKRWQWVDNFTLITGRHELKFGADFHYLPFNTTSEIFLGGRFIFGEGIPLGLAIDNDPRAGPGSSQLLAALLGCTPAVKLAECDALSQSITPLQAFNLGLPLVYQQGFGNPLAHLTNKLFGAYVQDSFRASQRLTLNLGFRYDSEFQPPPVHRDHNNFAPRIGFSFSAADHTVVRGGYGIYYAPIFEAVGFIARVLDGTQISEVLVPLDLRILPPELGIAATSAQVWALAKSEGILGKRVIAASDIAKLGLRPGITPAVISTVDKNIVNPYSQQGSFGVERAITTNLSLSANYLVNRGVKVLLGRNTNLRQSGTNIYGPTFAPIDPRVLQNNQVESSGSSTYHGMVLTATKRYSRKNQFQVSYTLSKAIDNVTDIVTDLEAANQLDLRAERGLASVDQRHRLVISSVTNLPFETTVAPIFIYSSGHPFNLLMGFDANGDTNPNTDRPPFAGRNTGIGPNLVTFDLRLAKDFRLGAEGSRRISAIIEAFNLFNRVNYSGVNTVVGTTLTSYRVKGRKDLSPSNPLGFTSAFDPRQIQLAVKFRF
jgi:hypothetical protein